MGSQDGSWNARDVRELTVLWSQRKSAGEISRQVGRSRNAVLSKAKRLGLLDATIILIPASTRAGQAAFRASVLAAYGCCCVTGATQPELIEAAHIIPYSVSGDHSVSNGLMLRVDLHCLFDAGLLTISDDYRLVLSALITDASYLPLQGTAIAMPADGLGPSLAALRWHRENVFAAKPAR